MSEARTVLLVVVAVLFLRGSSCLVVERPYPPPTAQDLVNAVRSAGVRLGSLRAETRMGHRSPQGKIKATVRLMLARGGKLRCDAVSPFDTPLLTLVSNGRDFALVDAQKNRHFHGPSSPCNIARLLGVALSPDDVLTVLGGSTPLIEYTKTTVAWDARAGAEVLTLEGKDLKQTIRLDGRNRTFDLLLSEVKNGRGEVLLRIEADSFRKVGALNLPREIHVSQPKLQAELDVAFKQQEVNLTLPSEAFDLPAPAGLPSQRVDCTTEIRP
jgi:outer membrane lipoprotein-sorting protein